MAYPTKVDELPSQPFFAVLVPTAVYIPGDERSRTFPGHGYPESTEYHWHIITFENEEKWQEDISRRMQHARIEPFKAVKILPANVTISTTLEF